MFILDTNILSEMMRLNTVPEVAGWIAGQDEDLLFTTAVSQAEVFSGLAIMAQGRRRRDLEDTVYAMFQEFGGRVLPFDTAAATAYAELYAVRRQAGRAAAPLDLMIAAIAHSRDASVVTRHVGDFDGCGLRLINPWAMQ